MSTISETCACGSQFKYAGSAPTSAIYDFREAHADCRASVPCRSCASCERELSAVRLELQAAVRERDQLKAERDAFLGAFKASEAELAALSRERKDTE